MRLTALLLLVATSSLAPSVESYDPTSQPTYGHRTSSKSKKGSLTPTNKASYGYAALEPKPEPTYAYSAENSGYPTSVPTPEPTYGYRTSSKSKKDSSTPTSKASNGYATTDPTLAPTYGYPGGKSKTGSPPPTSESKSYSPTPKSKSKTGYPSAGGLRTGWLDEADYDVTIHD